MEIAKDILLKNVNSASHFSLLLSLSPSFNILDLTSESIGIIIVDMKLIILRIIYT